MPNPTKKTASKNIYAKRSVTSIRDFEKLVKKRPKRPVLVSEGDSWFAYPPKNLFFGKSNVIDFIESKRQMNLLRRESNGAEAVQMNSGKQINELAKIISRNPVDVILFSGGGNDFVGSYQMDLYLKRKTSGMSWENCIHKTRFNLKMNQVENAYRLLLAVIEEFSKNPKLVVVTHTYDQAIPSDQGAEFFLGAIGTGPWMKPYMDSKGITKAADQRAIARYLIGEFIKRVEKVASQNPDRLKVVKTTGTLLAGEWANEIHPTKGGFKKVAEKIYGEVKKHI